MPLTNGIGAFSSSLGEFVLAAILYFAKDFRRMIRNQQRGVWEQFNVLCVSGKVVGIIGYGDIGRAVAERVRAMGMRVLALRRNTSQVKERDALVEKVYAPEQRNELLSLSDYVVVATPLTPETRGMIGEAEFAAMKPTAVVINVGRGPVIQEPALLQALTTNRIKGAALDVFDQEPLPPGHPFYQLENVLLSPHCADNTPDWLDDAMKLFLTQFERFRCGSATSQPGGQAPRLLTNNFQVSRSISVRRDIFLSSATSGLAGLLFHGQARLSAGFFALAAGAIDAADWRAVRRGVGGHIEIGGFA